MMNEKLVSVLSEVFDIKENTITETLTSEDVSKWDSLGQMDLVTTLEEEFNITLEMEEIIKIDSVKTILEVLEQKGVL